MCFPGIFSAIKQYSFLLVSFGCPRLYSALKSGPVSVLLPFLEELKTGPVPETFRIQEPRTRTTKNRKKPVVTSRNQSRNEYNKMRARSAKFGHLL